MPGLYVPPNRSHTELYAVDSIGALQVWYLSDSTTVGNSVVYLKADSLFLPYNRDTQNQLSARLSWDHERLEELQRTMQSKFRK